MKEELQKVIDSIQNGVDSMIWHIDYKSFFMTESEIKQVIYRIKRDEEVISKLKAIVDKL